MVELLSRCTFKIKFKPTKTTDKQIMKAAVIVDKNQGLTGTDHLEEGEVIVTHSKTEELEVSEVLNGLDYFQEDDKSRSLPINTFCSIFPVEAMTIRFDSLEQLRFFVSDKKGLWVYKILRYEVNDRVSFVLRHYEVCMDATVAHLHNKIKRIFFAATTIKDKEDRKLVLDTLKQKFYEEAHTAFEHAKQRYND
jgi:hypothetical protein